MAELPQDLGDGVNVLHCGGDVICGGAELGNDVQ